MTRLTAAFVVIAHLLGCVATAPKYTTAAPDFAAGLAAIEQNDFPLASYHFAELAKNGDPGAMNNLGVSLAMVGRKTEAIFWFNKAARYGDAHARETLAKLREPVPAPDLVGKHPAQTQKEARDKFVSAVALGVLIGVTGYYVAKSGLGTSRGNNSPLVPELERARDDGPRPSAQSSSVPLVEREVEVIDIYTRERYKGSKDNFGNATVRRLYDPGGPAFRGQLGSDGSGTLRTQDGAEIRVGPR